MNSHGMNGWRVRSVRRSHSRIYKIRLRIWFLIWPVPSRRASRFWYLFVRARTFNIVMAKISFFGGAEEVTGACYLIETSSAKILVDCGLFQCPGVCEKKNFDPFPFNPADMNAVFITHAHTDHTGRLPKLIRDGFRGSIYSTPATRELARLMLDDSLGLMQREEKREEKPLLFD